MVLILQSYMNIVAKVKKDEIRNKVERSKNGKIQIKKKYK